MSDETPGRCGTCRFWDRNPPNADAFFGQCERYPPQLSDHAVRFYAENPGEDDPDECEEFRILRVLRGPDVWHLPVTAEDARCGEYAAKKPEGGQS